jgi:hypothetical protein
MASSLVCWPSMPVFEIHSDLIMVCPPVKAWGR